MKGKSNSKGFAPIIILILLVLVGVGAYYFGTLKNKIVSVISTPTPVVSAQPSSSPIVIPTAKPTVKPTTDPTVNWKTYKNPDFSFKYPSGWALGQGTAIVSDVAGAGITVFTKDMPMYNECMKLDKTDTVNGKMVKYYSYIYSGEMCSNQADIGNYEVWVTKAGGDGFQPGIIYMYNTTIFPKSFSIFQQILSTFKFTQ
jgi:hypothetical protein